ncbi:apolipoprotein N-acyltransferase [Haloglycomyces albus]|uniref:apolipoprotein N-acyltransferase n=1 Tax=Haloglycomyces albus TaxID=526067 RepID=UPI00046D92CB|nr:apolipoprotein N-acyltransferase [Haloglycomyces albus]
MYQGRSALKLRPFFLPQRFLNDSHTAAPHPACILVEQHSNTRQKDTMANNLASNDAPTEPASPPRTLRRLVNRCTTTGALGRRLNLAVAIGVAIVAGLVGVLAFPPYGLWPLAVIPVMGLSIAVHRHRARAGLGIGFLAGMAFFLPLLAWSSTQVGQWPWIFLSALQALFIGLLGAALAASSRLIDRHVALWPLAIALGWSGQEALRDRQPFGGFPWGRLAFSQADGPLVNYAWLAGAPIVSFIVAIIAGYLLLLLWRRRIVAPLAVSAALIAGGLVLPNLAQEPGGDTVNVAVVQGNVPRIGLDFNAQRRAVLDNHVRGTLDLADRVEQGDSPQPDMVIWPENASDIDPFQNPDAAEIIQDAADTIDAPIFFGAIVTDDDGSLTNTSVVWEPQTGVSDSYTKQHPVPFAEYVPYKDFFRTVASWIDDRMAEGIDGVNGFRPGEGPAHVNVDDTVVSGIICFEIAYDGLVTDSVRNGSEILAVQTNNATFDNAEATQQLAMVRLRAIEHGRDSLMASTVGVSAFVDHTGAVHDPAAFNTHAILERQLTTSQHTTPATKLGQIPEVVLIVGGIALLSWAVVHNIQHRRREAVPE